MNEKEFYIDAGKKIKELREKAGLTQDDIAVKTGIDRTLISKFENTGKKISAFRLKQIIEAIGISASELFGEKKTHDLSIVLPDVTNGNGWADVLERLKKLAFAAQEAVDRGIVRDAASENQLLEDVRKRSQEIKKSWDTATNQYERAT
jgi:transcriptional regulator with XRE-family HTH domain